MVTQRPHRRVIKKTETETETGIIFHSVSVFVSISVSITLSRKLILIRHSAIVQNPDVPAKIWRLPENGRFLAHALAPKIALHFPAQIITSTETKAIETGQIIADELGIPCQTAADLHEHERTVTPYFPTKEAFQAAVSRFFQQPHELVMGEETAVQAQTRFVTAVNTVMTTYPSGNIAIVTHGTVLTLFANYHHPQLEPIPFWKALTLPCAFVTSWPAVAELQSL